MDINESKKLMDRMGEKLNSHFDVLKEYFGMDNGIYHTAQLLSETSINRMLTQLKKYGGVIISANVSLTDDGDIPDRIEGEYARWFDKTKKDDKREFIEQFSHAQTKKLIADLKQSAYSYSPVYGGYKGNDGITDLYEPSFVIYCFDKRGNQLDFEPLRELAINLCGEYYQNSVYIQEPGGQSYYYDKDSEKLAQETGPKKINRPEEEYFTALNKDKPQRFTDALTWLSESRPNVTDWYSNPCATTLNELRRRQEGWGERVFRLGDKEIL